MTALLEARRGRQGQGTDPGNRPRGSLVDRSLGGVVGGVLVGLVAAAGPGGLGVPTIGRGGDVTPAKPAGTIGHQAEQIPRGAAVGRQGGGGDLAASQAAATAYFETIEELEDGPAAVVGVLSAEHAAELVHLVRAVAEKAATAPEAE